MEIFNDEELVEVSYSETEFTCVLADQFKCSICFGVLNNPHQCKNGHCACLSCLQKSMKYFNCCPTCKIRLDKNSISKNLMLNQLILNMEVKCTGSDSNTGQYCFWKGRLESRPRHVIICPFLRDVECPFYREGNCIASCYGHTTRAGILIHLEHFCDSYVMSDSVKTEMIDSVRSGKYPFKSLRQFIYTGEMDDDMRHGHGVLVSPDGTSKYEGLWFNNKRHGRGVQTYPDWKYDGEWFRDKMHGFCEARTCELGTYSGPFVDNLQHGLGNFISADGTIKCSAEWIEGMRCGKGKEMSEYGVKYVGEFRWDMYHGHGELTRDDGKFIGNFFEGICQGLGRFESVDGVYQGEIKNFQYDGAGVWTGIDGTIYQGSFSSNKYHGQGSLTLPDGSVYNGWFVDGVKDGDDGELTYANGDKLSGCFRNGLPNGPGELHFANGSKYVGGFQNGKFSGHGELRTFDGDKYVGFFIEDVGCGKGSLVLADGSVFDGEFSRGQLNGIGTLMKADGTSFHGEFVDGLRHGKVDILLKGKRKYEVTFENDVQVIE